jgi:di/tricarboxylate transporter
MGVTPLLAWVVLLAVLVLIASGRFRIEMVALAGLLVLGVLGAAPPAVIFSGFGHPALATIIAIFLVSQGIINSGLMLGLGQALARRTHSQRGQILGVALAGSLLSAFMNNVGAVGLMLPTAVRMARRSGSSPGNFGLPLSIASILGGTLTLIGSAPNIIIASYMLSSTGQPFKMFDFAPHGLAMLGTAFLAWLFCRACGMGLAAPEAGESTGSGSMGDGEPSVPGK